MHFPRGIKFNPSKCTILSVSHSRIPLTEFYSLCGVVLSQASVVKYLGVSLSCDMEWAKHIQQVTSSCSSTIRLLHRNLSGCPVQLRERVYISLIKYRLDYASAIWDPHLKKHINCLEAIQRRAARFTTQDFGRTSSVSRMLEDLGWLPLKERRRDIRLSLVFQVIKGKVAVPVEDILERADSRTRSSHSRKYRQLPTNSTQYLHSFFFIYHLGVE